MAREDGRASNDSPNDSSDGQATDSRGDTERSSTWQVLTQAVAVWWRHHPVHLVIDIGRPFLNNYARDKPLQLLGIAAGAGAAAVLVKPWRLVSVTGLAVAVLRSTKLSSTLLSLLPRAAPDRYARRTQQSPKDAP